MKVQYLILFLLYFNFSCNHNKPDSEKISIDLNQSEKGKFSDIFSEINYLFLDMGESEVLVRPYQILFDSDRIIVEDRDLSNIHIFDSLGMRITSIKSSHSGSPGTIKQIEYLQVKDSKIFVSDIPVSKTLTFDLDGNFIQEKKDSIRFKSFHYFNKSRVLFLGLTELKNQNIFMKGDTSSTKDITFFYNYPKEYYWMGVGTKDGFMNDQSSSDVYFNIPYSYEVVRFDKNGNLHQSYEFDLGSKGISHDDRFRMAEDRVLHKHLAENGLINDVHSFFPTENHFFMYLYQPHGNGRPTHHFLVFNLNMKPIYQSFDPTNDLDGMLIGGIPWTYHRNKIYFIVDSISFYNLYIEKFSGQKVEIMPGSIHEFFQKNQEKLKDDQTVLVSLTLKDSI